MAESVSTKPRQEADFRSDGPASQSRLAANIGETRFQPVPTAGEGPLQGDSLLGGLDKQVFKIDLEHGRKCNLSTCATRSSSFDALCPSGILVQPWRVDN